ncbi:hypothetical protein TB2_022423 [Malus domestica]
MKQIGDLFRTNAFKPYKTQDLPGIQDFTFLGVPLPNNQTDDALETFCRDSLGSYWHYHGGCIDGKVVDGGLRVNGIDALRIVDSSTFPVTRASHPMGFYLMLGRYMGLQILQERSAWVGISSALSNISNDIILNDALSFTSQCLIINPIVHWGLRFGCKKGTCSFYAPGFLVPLYFMYNIFP